VDGDAGGCTPRAVRIGPREQFRGLIFFEVLKMAIPSESLPRGKWASQRLPAWRIAISTCDSRRKASLNKAARCTKLRPIATQILAEKQMGLLRE